MKKTQIQLTIEALEYDKRTIEMAIARLREQQASQLARVRKPTGAAVADIAEGRR